MLVETLFWRKSERERERESLYKIKWICFGYMNIRGCFNISPLRLHNFWSHKQSQGHDEIPSCLTPRSKWHSFTNMDILCFYSVLHNVSIMTCEIGALRQCAIVPLCQCVTVSLCQWDGKVHPNSVYWFTVMG